MAKVKVGDKVRAMRPYGDQHGFKSGQVVTVVGVRTEGTEVHVSAQGRTALWANVLCEQDLEPGEYKLAKQAMKRGAL